MVSRNMLHSIRESRFVVDSFVEEDSEWQRDDDDDEDEKEDNPPDSNAVVKAVSKETKKVRMWRFIVIFILLVAGGSTSALTYLILHGAEEEDFNTSYALFTDTIEDAATAYFRDIQVVFDGLAETITGAAITSGETFPFVTVPMFEVAGEHSRKATGIETVTFAPFVAEDQREAWEAYAWKNQGWLNESRAIGRSTGGILQNSQHLESPITPVLYQHESTVPPFSQIPAVDAPFLPAWHTSPPPFFPGYVNFNLMSEFLVRFTHPIIESTRKSLFSMTVDLTRLGSTATNEEDHNAFHAQFMEKMDNSTTGFDHPHSLLMTPVFEKLNDRNSPIVGIIFSVVPWDRYMTDFLPEGTSGVFCVLKNTCGQFHTYILTGRKAIYLGEGDLHERSWNDRKVVIDLYDPDTPVIDGNCLYSLEIYPSDELHMRWKEKMPTIFACVVAATFVIMALTFGLYDRFTRQRNKKVVKAAAKTDRIVASLFPSNVRDRLLAEEVDFEKRQQGERGARTRLKDFLANDGPMDKDLEETDDFMYKTKPIADLFPETTIMFADIAGFSAWSSAREPSQVFLLLESVYRAFDEIAKRRRVFKVETVGDCYVAAAGLPEARRDHAVVMARFARECMKKMFSLTRRLEVTLGPDTADLSLRVGIHSGPVTAGVLRGERSRFQLFGDTMNTASRMESTGLPQKIQISQETADLLFASSKGRWIVQRDDRVVAKGKGELQTYWLQYHTDKSEVASSGNGLSEESVEDVSNGSDGSFMEPVEDEEEARRAYSEVSAKTARLIDWNKDVLLRLLKAIVARRQARNESEPLNVPDENFDRAQGVTVLDEVKEVVALPAFEPLVVKREVNPDTIDLGVDVEEELGSYIATIASMYRDNPFHNFDHASHVTLSVSKLLTRIVMPSDFEIGSGMTKSQMLHDHTYGITSDPLTQFSCVLSALIHDVDHTGVPNTQLAKENQSISNYYKGRSIAEQNSVDMAWELLMDPTFAKLRATIYRTDEEMRHFRQLIVNVVLATDIMDKDLKTIRNQRWEKAFSAASHAESTITTVHRKATIVIEHLIQASDVSHTMQHWHIYRKWNQRLFEEMYVAYKSGRAEKSPAEFWYRGEIGFFDFYIIPLAKKLKDCGVFGVSSDEYLNYAMQNRAEWEEKGQSVVAELIQSATEKYG